MTRRKAPWRRTDQVSPELAEEVFRRDGECLAPRLGGSAMDCWGRNTIAHVKAHARMAKRAEPQLDRLATICQGHAEDGMKAGYVWVSDKKNVEALREYLHNLYPNGVPDDL